MSRVFAAALMLCLAAQGAGAECRLDKGPERTVARVIDAETVELDDATRVRLSGIVAPRARDAGVPDGRWGPETEAMTALDALVTAKAVRLQFDKTRRDRHGNTLAHLIRVDDAEGPSVQEHLLAAGHARVDAVDGQRACIETLLAAENIARAGGRGLWSEPAYRVRAAEPARDIAAYVGTLQVITGTVAKVESGRGVVRLMLGDDRRRDVSLTIRSTDRDTAGLFGGDLKQLTGRQVEARGWLTQRPGGGPEIDVSLAGHVRVLEGAAPPRRRRAPQHQ